MPVIPEGHKLNPMIRASVFHHTTRITVSVLVPIDVKNLYCSVMGGLAGSVCLVCIGLCLCACMCVLLCVCLCAGL